MLALLETSQLSSMRVVVIPGLNQIPTKNVKERWVYLKLNQNYLDTYFVYYLGILLHKVTNMTGRK